MVSGFPRIMALVASGRSVGTRQVVGKNNGFENRHIDGWLPPPEGDVAPPAAASPGMHLIHARGERGGLLGAFG